MLDKVTKMHLVLFCNKQFSIASPNLQIHAKFGGGLYAAVMVVFSIVLILKTRAA